MAQEWEIPYLSKYDTSYEYPVSMYDTLPYMRDSDYCNAEYLTLHSDKMIKYFSYHKEDTICTINNHDEDMEHMLVKLRQLQAQQLQQQSKVDTNATPAEEVTEEQIQTLLEDTQEETRTGTNAFEGIEDW